MLVKNDLVRAREPSSRRGPAGADCRRSRPAPGVEPPRTTAIGARTVRTAASRTIDPVRDTHRAERRHDLLGVPVAAHQESRQPALSATTPASAIEMPATCTRVSHSWRIGVGEQHRRDRVQRAEHGDERQQAMPAGQREERVRGHVQEPDRRRSAAASGGSTRRARARHQRPAGEQDREQADARTDERRERTALAAAQSEEVREEAERDRGQLRRSRVARARFCLGRSPLLRRGRSTAPVSARRWPPRPVPKPCTPGGDRDGRTAPPRRTRRPARRCSSSPARAPCRTRPGRSRRPEHGEHPEPERAPVDLRRRAIASATSRTANPAACEIAVTGDRRQPPREQAAAEVGEAPRRRRGEREQDGDRAHALKLIDRAGADADSRRPREGLRPRRARSGRRRA